MMNNEIQAAIYARVSSEQQATDNTIDSQLVALKQRLAADGLVVLEELQFIDDGYRGPHWYVLAWNVYETMLHLEEWIDFMSILQTDWHVSMPTRYCWWMSCTEPEWR